ncbi:hypothetical protein H5971_02840 [Lactobacillus coleohominis]|nr:glycosyltransferase [Limosilactobacillus coleohominis]MBM6954603.1 hypothetical protein [Limosilactobacillus coleohominis]
MVPKIIHYIWFGNGEKSQQIKEALSSWKKILIPSGYKIVEWNEENWDINYNDFTRQNYDAGKYAYVSDVARLDILNQYGGIYLDADTVIKKDLDDLLDCHAFFGMMYNNVLSAGIIATEKDNVFIKSFLESYNSYNREMLLNETLPATNNELLTMDALNYYPDFKLVNKKQVLSDNTVIYPKEYFTYPTFFSENDYADQLFEKSWANDDYSQTHYILKGLSKKLLGRVIFGKISSYRGAKRYSQLNTYERGLRKNGN